MEDENALNSDMTFRGGLADVFGGDEGPGDGACGEEEVGGAPGVRVEGRGGSRPPGTYLNAPCAFVFRNDSVRRLMGTFTLYCWSRCSYSTQSTHRFDV